MYIYNITFICSGLQLILPNEKSPFRAFTYALGPTTRGINPVKRKVIVLETVEGDHVIVHKLQPEDRLAEKVSDYRSTFVKAVVVVNTADSYELDPSHIEGMDESNFPVLVLSASDGHDLLNCLEHFEDRDVLCDIEVESTVDVQSSLPPQAARSRAKTGGREGAAANDRPGVLKLHHH